MAIPGFFNFVRVHNTGIAFGRFNEGSASNIIFTVVALAALAGILIFWARGSFPGKLNSVAVALLVAGIFGNLTDRLWHGYVVDFLDFYIGDHHWPSFNVADSCICVAAALLFIAAFRPEPQKDGAPQRARGFLAGTGLHRLDGGAEVAHHTEVEVEQPFELRLRHLVGTRDELPVVEICLGVIGD